MQFRDTPIHGAYVIDLDKRGDERGFFARALCQKEFEAVGLPTDFVQINNSLSVVKGTLRGMHYQLAPYAETKLIRCIRGSLWDCILDLRPESDSFGKWFGTELSAENRRMMVCPKGCAHGFMTLEPNSEVFYFVDEFYNPDEERGVRWDDPEFGIQWPAEPMLLSDRDRQHPDFDPQWHLASSAAATKA
jgi:dTDP-4-dehydrorhamnose 3,5-epimerase